MIRYKNLNGDSGIYSYEIGNDFVKVRFEDDMVYTYTYSSAGTQRIENMKRLAVQGHGLNSYINTNVRKLFASKRYFNNTLDL